MSKSILTLSVLLISHLPLWSDPLDLQTAVNQALEANFEIRLEAYSQEQAHLDLESEDARFDWSIDSNVSYRERLSPGSNTDQSGNSSPSSESIVGGVGLNKRTSWGTRVDLDTGSNYSSFSEDVATSISASISQPLLSGAGRTVNLAGVFRRKVQAETALLQFQGAALDVIEAVSVAYLDLALIQEEERLFASSVAVVDSLLKETLRRQELGLATDVEVLRAQVSLAERQEAQLSVARSLEAASDRLQQLLGVDELGSSRLVVAPVPEDRPEIPESSSWIEWVLDRSLELKISENNQRINERNIAVAERNLLPDIGLRLSGSLLGRSEDIADAYEDALNRSGYNWSAGLSFSMPWGRRAEKADLRSAQINQEREHLRRERTGVELQIDARRVLRDLETGLARLELAETQVTLNQTLFEQERARYRAGTETFREVLEAQRAYDNSELNRLQRLRAVHRADLSRARLDHELFERYGIIWDAGNPLAVIESSDLEL